MSCANNNAASLDSQDTVIEVKGSASTVTISWNKENEEREVHAVIASDQMMDGGKDVYKSHKLLLHHIFCVMICPLLEPHHH